MQLHRAMQICVLLSIFSIAPSYRDDDGHTLLDGGIDVSPDGHQRKVKGLVPSSNGSRHVGGDTSQLENVLANRSEDPAVSLLQGDPHASTSGDETKKQTHVGLTQVLGVGPTIGEMLKQSTPGNKSHQDDPLPTFESARDLSCQLHRGDVAPGNDQEASIYYHNASILGRFRRLGLSFPVSPPEGGKLPRIIWSFWDGPAQGEVEKLALASWREMNPGWEHRILNFASAMELLQSESEPLLTKAFIEKLNSWERKTDLIRLMLLQRFGGVWADATLFCTRPLDDYVFQMVSAANFSAPTWGEPRQPCGLSGAWTSQMHSINGLSSHFLAAVPHSYIVERWLYAFSRLLYNGPCGNPEEWDYFFVHLTFDSLIDNDPLFAKKWEDTLKLNSGDTHSVHTLEAPLTPELKELIQIPRAPVWKFNKMTGYSNEDARRCADASFVCGYIKRRMQARRNARKSKRTFFNFGVVHYKPRHHLMICNLPDLWLDTWQAAKLPRHNLVLWTLCAVLLVLPLGLYVWFRARGQVIDGEKPKRMKLTVMKLSGETPPG